MKSSLRRHPVRGKRAGSQMGQMGRIRTGSKIGQPKRMMEGHPGGVWWRGKWGLAKSGVGTSNPAPDPRKGGPPGRCDSNPDPGPAGWWGGWACVGVLPTA